ncbi:MAG TPA: lipopolysaccharide assembly protein LapA domain-containing protein [Dokdonella sp.]|jgi:lipopolysaccharide assembly protein A|nr:lipopolysaccharide assembly protein LapA domain-containing protein [Dokdonella sp.]
MRLGVVVLILLSIVFGATFGALNSERIAFDLYVTEFLVPKGAALLAALLLGWVLGGLVVWLLHVRRLRRELRASNRLLRESRAELTSIAARDKASADA